MREGSRVSSLASPAFGVIRYRVENDHLLVGNRSSVCLTSHPTNIY